MARHGGWGPALLDPALPLGMCYEAFLDWWGKGSLGEWVAGEGVACGRPRLVRQRLIGSVSALVSG